ncbi:MAG: hypothetical protein GQ583_05140 [Methyloprofundus sp.]|nr:hypothetical protein [Methyloprofundus sp.]
MKIINLLIFIFSISPAYAEIYKCIENGNTSYQQTQCKQTGTEFIPAKDISTKQQEAAVEKLSTDLEANAEKKKIQKEADDKERLLRAQENNADASYENAKAIRAQAEATARQTDALENNNNYLRDQPYFYPLRPVVKPLPSHPIEKPLPARPVPKLSPRKN